MTSAAPTRNQPAPVQVPPSMGRWPFGVLRAFARDPLALYLQGMKEGDLVRMRFPTGWSYTLYHPDYVQHILQDNNRNYRRADFSNRRLKMISGNNILTSDGDFWRRQRRLMQPAFHRKRIAGFSNAITRAADEMLEQWHQHPSDQPLGVDQEMMRVTLRVVGEALFSHDLTSAASVLGKAISAGSEYFTYRVNSPIAPPLWVPTPRNRHYVRARDAAEFVVPDMIQERRKRIATDGPAEAAGRTYDLLDLLLDARYEDTGEAMNDGQLEREVRIMISAGHETTANTLSWALYLLSRHEDVAARLENEVDSVLGGRTPELADLAKLSYTRMVIDETQRLYPAAWIMARQANEEDQLGPYHLPANAGLVIPIHAIHRNPQFWPDPERFDPDRFNEERKAEHHRFAHVPFGGGPRLCIGRDFALMEAHLILAMICQRFRLRIPEGYRAEPQPLITLRVKGGLPMYLEPR